MIFGPYPAVVLDWHDGDTTAKIDLDLGFGVHETGLALRVYGINAPELSTDAGKAALVYVRSICPAGTHVSVVSRGWDKYGGRFDGTITLPDGHDLASLMLSSGNAVPYAP